MKENLALKAQTMHLQGRSLPEICASLERSETMVRLYLDPEAMEAHKARSRAQMALRYAKAPKKHIKAVIKARKKRVKREREEAKQASATVSYHVPDANKMV